MKQQKLERSSIMDWAAVCMAVLLILGRAVPLRPLDKVFLFAVTLDRLAFSALTIALLIRRFIRRKTAVRLSREFCLFLGMMVFWMLYGAAAGFLSPYSGLWEAGKECFLLLRGVMVVYCMYEILDTRRRTELFLSALRWVCVALLLLAVWEGLSGRYMWTSRYPSMPTVILDGRSWMTGLYRDVLFLSTGICLNENNFSTVLTLLLPLFFLTKGIRPGKAAAYGIVLTLGTFVLLLNDANINALALLVSLLAYVVLARGNWGKKAGMLAGFFLLYTKAAAWVGLGLLKLKNALFPGPRSEELLARAGLEDPVEKVSGVLSSSLAGNLTGGVNKAVSSGGGALMLRLKIYRDGWDAFLASRGLGLGPGGYQAYFQEHPGRTKFVDPHNWWLEILCKYGVFVFLAYLAVLLTLYVRLVRTCLRRRDELLAVAAAICTGFVIACVAPSGYIGEVYQWFVPGLCLTLLRQSEALNEPLS